MKAAAADSNVAAQQEGLAALCAFLKFGSREGAVRTRPQTITPVVEKGLLHAGDERVFEASRVSRFVLGNASSVDVNAQGRAVDLAPYTRANVARFTLSSDGSLAPIARP